jgi:hypothetical protein
MVQVRSPYVAAPLSAALNSPDAMASALHSIARSQQLTALKALRFAANACERNADEKFAAALGIVVAGPSD